MMPAVTAQDEPGMPRAVAGPPALYSRLADLWRVFSPPDEYAEEVATFRARLLRHGVPDGGSLLHLGSGGGSVDHHLVEWYRVSGVDISPDMIDQARLLNPRVEYVRGDIRDIRLGRSYDAVLVHDAIAYMTSVAELEAVYRTAAEHLRPGGIMLALPEELKSRLAASEPTATARAVGDIELTVLETHYDADPSDNVFESIYVFLIRQGDALRVELDRHVVGVFELDDFLGAIRRAGFDARAERWELSVWDDEPEMPLIVAVKR
jgi:SAM-dependent methyltransferase